MASAGQTRAQMGVFAMHAALRSRLHTIRRLNGLHVNHACAAMGVTLRAQASGMHTGLASDATQVINEEIHFAHRIEGQTSI